MCHRQKTGTRPYIHKSAYKNDGKDAFPTIAAAAAANLYVDDADCGSNAIDDVGAYMANAQKSRIKVSSADNYVSINGKSYPGSFEFIGTEEGIVAVNTVDVETYVRYVLPSEMPSTFDAEALKAQAVCARTFVYSQMKIHSMRYTEQILTIPRLFRSITLQKQSSRPMRL